MLAELVSGTMHLLNGMNCKLPSNYTLTFPLEILKLCYQMFFRILVTVFFNSLLLCSCVVSVLLIVSCECLLFSGLSWKRDLNLNETA